MAQPYDATEAEILTERDTSRGIQKVQVSRSGEPYDTRERQGKIQEEFLENESVAARAYKKRRPKKGFRQDKDSEQELLRDEAEAYARQVLRTQLETERAIRKTRVATMTASTSGMKLGGLLRLSSLFGVGGMFTAYLLLLPFALASLFAFAIDAEITNFVENNFLGRTAAALADGVNTITLGMAGKLFSYLPSGEEVGLFLTFFVLFINLALVLAYTLWYFIQGIAPFGKTALSHFFCYTLVAFGILPFTNVLPWLTLWVLYINATSLFTNVRKTLS